MTPWLIAAGDFTPWGGMDRANYELAWYLADGMDVPVHLVAHRIEAPLATHPRVIPHIVPRPLNMHLLGGPLLDRTTRELASQLSAQGARIVVNGGNCRWPDVNWVHAVHAAWDNRISHAPVQVRLRAGFLKRAAIRDERRSLNAAKIVIANSHAARRQIVEQVGIPDYRVHAVYYGIDKEVFRPHTVQEKVSARAKLGLPSATPIVSFIGALGHDRNKGFDVLFEAWRHLCAGPDWDAMLLAVGAGAEVELWNRQITACGLGHRIRMTGFSKDVPLLLTACDAMVHPTHYEAYGLGVHEALCCGLPVMVTASAGVAERYPDDLKALLLSSPPSVEGLADALRCWRADQAGFANKVGAFAANLRERSWRDMARDIVELVSAPAAKPTVASQP
jgi:glycosyltransferase involved in cell wall biosynthesis